MATLVLGAAGAAIGSSIGGAILGVSAATIGGFIGSSIGSVVDSWIISSLAPTQRIEGARLDTLRITSATEGAVIPRLYGRMRMGGNIIWATDFREETKTTTQGGGKGGGGGKPGQKAPEIGHDGVHPRLLQHDFRDPDGVGRPRFRAPRQVARVAREPRQQAAPDDGRHALDPVSGHEEA